MIFSFCFVDIFYDVQFMLTKLKKLLLFIKIEIISKKRILEFDGYFEINKIKKLI